MDVKLESLPSEEAIRYLRSKANITTRAPRLNLLRIEEALSPRTCG